jgi:hypothetical protein
MENNFIEKIENNENILFELDSLNLKGNNLESL